MELDIDGLDPEGRGLGRDRGLEIHVAGALPGDHISAEVEHRSPHRPEAWARLLGIERSSPDRVAGSCPATGRCGGCPLGALGYPAQQAWKARRLERLLAPLNHVPDVFVPAPSALGYRGQAKLVYGRDARSGEVCLGAYAPRSHDIVDLAGCRVVEPVLESVRAALLAALRSAGVTPYEERKNDGLLAYVVLRANVDARVLVTLVGSDLDELARLASEHD